MCSEETEFDNKKSARNIAARMAVAGLTSVGKLAPTVTIESGKGLSHTIISNAQNYTRWTFKLR
ncbi:hypothetical protein B7P25_12685 [Bacillus thuringiensis]|nr:hypothetical protein B7P25_12685 [Bacillus thuringiensis]